MKLTFPHMGNIWLVGKTLFETLGHEVIIPPKNTKKTVELGTTYAPEFACFPLKVTLGNFMEAAQMGADTMFMAGGGGPCRFGLYGHIQKEILNGLGYNIDAIILDPPGASSYKTIFNNLKKVIKRSSVRHIKTALKKGKAKVEVSDYLEKKLGAIRPYEMHDGKNKDSCEKIENDILKQINKEEDLENILGIKEEIDYRINKLNLMPRPKSPTKVAIVGEIYMVLEPFVNFEVEKRLGEMGCEVTRGIYLNEWIDENLNPFTRKEYKKKKQKIQQKARPYIKHFVGGHGRESIGEAIHYAEEGFDGVIHVSPFTCMPENTAQSVFPNVSYDYNIPVLSLMFDEQTGEAGTVTRLEAFTDLIKRKKKTA